MHGNVWEWVEDGYQTYPDGEVIDPPAAPSSGGVRVYRGGSFKNDPQTCRSANRDADSYVGAQGDYGFRLYRSFQ
jgi:formylglycine-generating enzyme required for sulfatase activity